MKNRRVVAGFLMITLCLPIAGCSNDPNAGVLGMGQKESVGTGVGAALGGTLGGLFGGKYAALAAIGGAAVAGLIGNRVGAMLDDEDRAALLRQQQQVLSQQGDGVSENWASTHTQATATITALNTRTESKQVSLLRQASVAAPTGLVSIGARYNAKKSTPIRLAPEAAAESAENLRSGSRIWVTGSVQNGAWYLVSRGGQAIGYVPSSRLARVVHTAPKVQSGSATTQVAKAANDNAPINLDDVEPVDKVATANAVPTIVTASVTCRDLRTVASGGASAATSNSNACLSPQGVWEVN